MRIGVNNDRYLLLLLNNNEIIVETRQNKGDKLEMTRVITESEFVDLYNILCYANDNDVAIHELWKVID